MRAHDRRHCRDFNRTEPWACGDCDCTARLEKKLSTQGDAFLESLATCLCNQKVFCPFVHLGGRSLQFQSAK